MQTPASFRNPVPFGAKPRASPGGFELYFLDQGIMLYTEYR